MIKIIVLCAILLLVDVKASSIAKRDVQMAQPLQQGQNFAMDVQKNVDQFRNCVDQGLANMVGQINEKQLQPLFSAVGDTINRFTKAFDDLTATTKPATQK
ncbi:uncharacterized protein LOC114355530 isoform X2 [Ostrinia furnacalis]|uniref:uncharacterized protein LOC114355530 isoform X2 n=1 Tax=Ostrinia furnacalis TaxID=93504 RepID=UPI00103DD8DF|nr:uncharacterized protein LOC114355530 isoform X2 [Ostrinia furnacalis]